MGKWKNRTVIFLLLLMLITACSADGQADDISENAVNSENKVSSNQTDDSSDMQTDEKEIICENPYFFPQNTFLMTSTITYIENIGKEIIATTELELQWLKQYNDGCLARLSILPFDKNMPGYMDETRINIYFYVTSDKIYQISCQELQDTESFDMDGNNENNDNLLMSVLDTDEKLINYGELVCCTEGAEDLPEEEAGTHTSIVQQGNQISCNRVDIGQNGELDFYEKFIWEEGIGLVSYWSGYDTESFVNAKLVYLDDILYGTAGEMQDREIVCENPYFFSQDVSALEADITYQDWENFITIKGELELHWLKQYDNGCLARLSVAPFDCDMGYLTISYFDMYFYVTPDEIYRIYFYVSSADRPFDSRNAYAGYNDYMIMTVLNTDERLIKYGNLVCSLERIQNDVKEGEEGTYLSIIQEGEQVLYRQSDVTPYNLNDWENYCWEKGFGLVEYRKGFRAERDPFYIENIIVK